MFQDIVKLTQFTLVNALENKNITLDTKKIYDAYRAMQRAIDTMRTLEVNYLPIAMDSDFLQNSSHGAPFKKWYFFTEQDFDKVRKNLREYLVNLIDITYCVWNEEDGIQEHISIMEKFSEPRRMFGFFSYHYESGKLSTDGLSILHTKLIFEQKNYYENSCIVIDTHEKRVALCEEIRVSVKEMKDILKSVKSYLLSNASLEELL